MRFAFLFLLIIAAGAASANEEAFDIGPWRLGMKLEQVQSFTEFGPYERVQVTGGLETKNAIFQGKKTNTSFVFDPSGLEYIQVWKYEGNDPKAAQEAVVDIFHLFSSKFGGAEIDNIDVKGPNGSGLSEAPLRAVLERILGTAQEMTGRFRKEKGVETLIMFDMRPSSQPFGSRLHSQFGYSSRYDTFYVFLYQDRSDAPTRRIQSNIQLERSEP